MRPTALEHTTFVPFAGLTCQLTIWRPSCFCVLRIACGYKKSSSCAPTVVLIPRLDCADTEDAERVWTGTGTRIRTIPILRLALSYLRVLVPVVLPMRRIS